MKTSSNSYYTCRLTKYGLTVVLLVLFSGVVKASWYERVAVQCSGLTSLNHSLNSSPWFSRKLSVESSHPSAGYFYVNIEAGLINTAIKNDGSFVYDRVKINKSNKKSLKKLLDIISEGVEVPSIVESVSKVMMRYLLPVSGALVTKKIFSWLIDEQNAVAADFKLISYLVADGGELRKYISLNVLEDKATYIIVYDIYTVKIGRERKSFILNSCRYPVKRLIDRFETTSGVNDKVIKKDNTGEWRMFDVESNKYSSQKLEYIGQDKEYYFFNKYYDGTLDAKWRISMHGGDWQMQRDGWATLYKNVSSL
ncbi:MAG: hypothetical protein KZQ77_12555 [Candidatus Thiodiazotropha sp. (ex Notomyrtea botanica)]|nr:hypothetical protein [Candidatus Thiodiazotropha sp. (ex Notomyrtea botanica)]